MHLYHQHLLMQVETSPQLSSRLLLYRETIAALLILIREQSLIADAHVSQLPIFAVLRLLVDDTVNYGIFDVDIGEAAFWDIGIG